MIYSIRNKQFYYLMTENMSELMTTWRLKRNPTTDEPYPYEYGSKMKGFPNQVYRVLFITSRMLNPLMLW